MNIKTIVADITPSRHAKTIRTGEDQLSTPTPKSLEANIVVFEMSNQKNFAVVSLDTTFSSSALETAIQNKKRDKTLDFVVVATHSHDTPQLDPSYSAGALSDTDLIEDCASIVARALDQATSSPHVRVSLSIAHTTCTGNVYRRKKTLTITPKKLPVFGCTMGMSADRSREISKKLTVVAAHSEDDTLVCLLWTWPCHATANSDHTSMNSDFPGYVREMFRESHVQGEAVPVLYFPGFCGDIRPDSATHFSLDRERLNRPFANLFVPRPSQWFRSFCDEVASGVIRAYEKRQPLQTDSIFKSATHTVDATRIFNGISNSNINILRLYSGELEILLVNAEVCSGYEEMIRSFLPTDAICSGLVGQMFGYLPTDSQIVEGGYESVQFINRFDLDGQYHNNIQSTIVAGVKDVYNI